MRSSSHGGARRSPSALRLYRGAIRTCPRAGVCRPDTLLLPRLRNLPRAWHLPRRSSPGLACRRLRPPGDYRIPHHRRDGRDRSRTLWRSRSDNGSSRRPVTPARRARPCRPGALRPRTARRGTGAQGGLVRPRGRARGPRQLRRPRRGCGLFRPPPRRIGAPAHGDCFCPISRQLQ